MSAPTRPAGVVRVWMHAASYRRRFGIWTSLHLRRETRTGDVATALRLRYRRLRQLGLSATDSRWAITDPLFAVRRGTVDYVVIEEARETPWLA